MHLHWDWRLARVVDAEAVIIDESVWDGVRSSGSVADRIEMVRRNRMTPEARDLSERFPEARPSFTNPNDWPSFSSEEIMLLDQASIILARRGLEESAGDVDRRMEHLVHAVEEMRVGWTTIESRVVEWVGLFLTEINLDEKRRNIVTATSAASFGMSIKCGPDSIHCPGVDSSSLITNGVVLSSPTSPCNIHMKV